MNLEEHVDLGSWARFEPTLAAFLDGPARPDGARPGATLLLTAPAPVVVGGPAPAAGLLARLRRRRAGPASPHPPGMALTGRADGVEIVLPVLDARGGALLGPEQVDSLRALGWWMRAGALARLLPDGEAAAAIAVRVLIEVLRVAHPADLDHREPDAR